MSRFFTLCAAACVGTTTGGNATPADCERIHTEWQGIHDELVSNTTCVVDEDCHAPYDLCDVQLGGCQVAVSTVVTEQDLEDVRDGYVAEAEAVDCDTQLAVCDCYGGYTATCDDGTCTLAGPFYTP